MAEFQQEIYKVTIEGVSPLLMNRPSELMIDAKSKERKNDNESPKEKAATRLYVNKDGKLVMPDTHLKGCLVEAGKKMKVSGKGSSRATYSKIIGYAAEINPMEIEHKIQDWEVFSVLATNPTTKGRNMLHRPMLNEWSVDFEIHFDSSEIPQETLKQILDIGGRTVGVGDWRPDKKGRFGKFQVTRWEKA